MKNILVSACLLGIECRYFGDGKENAAVIQLLEKYHLIPVCPEQLGGMPTPRNPVELKDGRAYDAEGRDFTVQFEKGAQETLRIAELFGCRAAVMKSKSPSCGCGMIYDCTFSGKLVPGNGKAAELLLKNGVQVCTEQDLSKLSGD